LAEFCKKLRSRMVQLALKSRCLGELTCRASKPVSGHRNQPWRHHQAPAPCRANKHLALHAIAAGGVKTSQPPRHPPSPPLPPWQFYWPWCASHSAPGPGRLRRALASVSRRRTEPVVAAVHQVQPGGGGGVAARLAKGRPHGRQVPAP
jgi:hypothetical protein